MTKNGRTGPNKDLMSLFNNFDKEFDENVLETSRRIIEKPGCSSSSTRQIDPYQPVNDDCPTDLTITKVTPAKGELEPFVLQQTIPNDDIVVKKEVVNLVTKKKPVKNVKFSLDEDKHLEKGIKKYGRKAWALILKDSNFNFHSSRTRDSLRMRADSSTFKNFSSL